MSKKKRKCKRRYKKPMSAQVNYYGENKHHLLWMYKKWAKNP